MKQYLLLQEQFLRKLIFLKQYTNKNIKQVKHKRVVETSYVHELRLYHFVTVEIS